MKAVSRELWKIILSTLSIQEIKWSNCDAEGAGDKILFGKVYDNYQR
jgi:hypothetical protein